MADFVKLSIFGTVRWILLRNYEVTHLLGLRGYYPICRLATRRNGCLRSRLVSSLHPCRYEADRVLFSLRLASNDTFDISTYSSAKDQLSGTSVAIKKIMKPFSTPVLSKRTYRELKLLKHLRHENVGCRDYIGSDRSAYVFRSFR